MLKNGVFLQNRYEIISRIGSGGMADVYKARDHKLNRFVAVKVLKSEFRDDKQFLSKFRVEAQAAAGLAHANIVNVYDVGEDRGTSFIVMELVEGITLKTYIAKKGRLSFREAASIALQVSSGLEAAHNNGIVHRDVKPQNILISMNGKAKIADFGIAHAASSDTINSSAMGSVHYSAPEQTRGGYSDAKSDIYSLGITMYEMLTGRVPFDGDSTVEVALKQLQEEIPSPKSIVPDLPHSIEQIILKCTQKSPDRRYAGMGELIRDLKESLINPEGDFVVIPEVDRKAHTILLSKEEVSQIKSGSMPSYDQTLDTGAADAVQVASARGTGRGSTLGDNSYYQSSSLQHVKEEEETLRGESSVDYDPEQEQIDIRELEEEQDLEAELEKLRRRRRSRRNTDRQSGLEKAFIVTGIILAVAVLLTLLFFVGRAVGLFGSTTQTGSEQTFSTGSEDDNVVLGVTVPQILGKGEEEAQKMLKEAGLGYRFQGEMVSDVDKGLVCEQSVESGTRVEKDTVINYRISSGSGETLSVPDLTSAKKKSAEKTLKGMGLEVSIDNSRYSNTVPEGRVITTNPGVGSTVNKGDIVTIYISQGPDSSLVEMPVLTEHTENDAKQVISNLGLYVYVRAQSSESVPKGIVIDQDIEPGSMVATGSSVTITVSTGPETPAQDETGEAEGTWSCLQRLNAPEGYTDQPVRIVLEQNGTQTTIFEGQTTFPYILSVEGLPGVGTGTAYVYILDETTGDVVSTTTYDGIVFEQEE